MQNNRVRRDNSMSTSYQVTSHHFYMFYSLRMRHAVSLHGNICDLFMTYCETDICKERNFTVSGAARVSGTAVRSITNNTSQKNFLPSPIKSIRDRDRDVHFDVRFFCSP